MNDEIITNEQRAAWAQQALEAYSRSIEGGEGLYAGMETVAIDLLCDLFHLVYRNELEPLDLVEMALSHFQVELALAGDEFDAPEADR